MNDANALQAALVTTVLDTVALAAETAREHLPGDFAQQVTGALNAAAEAILYLHERQNLGAKMLVLNEQLLNKTVCERDHWKANHDEQVERARVLMERPDMPLERIRAYATYRAAVVWATAVDDELSVCGSTTDSYKSPREAVRALIDWHVAVALDPAVSKDAQALIDRGAAQCKCDMRTRMVGDGCAVCNPAYAEDMRGD